jgi:hypothetical protein
MRIAQVMGGVMVIAILAGCGGRKSSLLLERHARGPLTESKLVAQRVLWKLEPVTQTHEQQGIEVTATFAATEFLSKLFSDRAIFGPYAGLNPYFLENLVFYVKIANRSDKRILINPTEFALVDDRGNQYSTINEDYVTALAEAHAPMATVTRGVIEDARPGYFGVGLPVGKIIATKPQGRFALIKQSSLQRGLLYPGVVHDGLIAFWSPAKGATKVQLLVTNVKTDFDANDVPGTTLEFPFTFTVLSQ